MDIPAANLPPRIAKTAAGKAVGRKLILVLEQASLESVKTKKVRPARAATWKPQHSARARCGWARVAPPSPSADGTPGMLTPPPLPPPPTQGFELLNSDDHVGLHKKHGRNPASSRPDISHQLLLTLLDSPLNKAGLLLIYVETTAGVLIEVSPSLRIPRTFKRFAGLIVQLLEKLKVRAADSPETLLRVVKNPVTRHLPVGAPIIGLEAGAPLVEPFDLPTYAPLSLPDDGPIVFVIGAMSHGDVKADYIQHTVALSRYPLSAAGAAAKLCGAFERAWQVG